MIILEGILILHDPRVRGLMNMKIFVDTGFSFSILFMLDADLHILEFCIGQLEAVLNL